MSHSTFTPQRIQNFIDGSLQNAAGDARFDKLAPATGTLLAQVADASAEDVDLAVQAAARAFEQRWKSVAGAQRARMLNRLADVLERDASLFVQTLAAEQGRPPMEMTLMDLPMCVDTLRYFAGWADKLEGRTIPTAGFMGGTTFNYTRRVPLGVAALVIPWNAPLMICIWKLAPALAAGCTVVIKAPEDAPLAIAQLADALVEAGFPPGVVNIVHGRAATGAALVGHALVRKISFTGSTNVGRLIARDAAASFKHLTLELGGKAAQIVFPDADIAQAVQGVAMGLFANQGQTCAAGSRVLVHRSLIGAFEQALGAAARSMRVGRPDEAGVQMGALINARHQQRVRDCIAAGLDEGARMVAGEEAVPAEGFFVRPTLFADVRNDMRIAQQEIFGPVGMLIPFDSEDEAVQMANHSEFGLSASLWTRDLATAHRVAAWLEVGAVAVNCWSPLDARLPWGGGKDSGLGRDLSAKALDTYLEERIVTVML
ncbi:aldehyde dehydrogenase family protein [Variovorax sp. GB1P17]|uniref:aldehyde dehydrogenase family protein n=1 Tax=Variovorax sp. GB1P17 TaxID=3443740 RepID=UPI003F45EDEE